MRNQERRKGITLIALVITIIILLILAGIGITVVINGGIIQQAQNASNKYKEAQEEEQKQLDELYAYLKGEGLPENSPTTNAGTNVKLPEKWATITPNYVSDENGKVEIASKVTQSVYAVSDGKGNTIPVPIGFYYVGGDLDTGVVISDNIKDKNKYVSFENTQEVSEGIPAGVIYNIDGTVKTEENLTEEEKKSVIFGNQFVWIPCTITNYSKITTAPTNADILNMTTGMAEKMQIKKYGGFYVGRYEAGTSSLKFEGGYTHTNPTDTQSNGVNNNFKSSKVISGKITQKAGEIPYFFADYATAVEMSEAMYDTEYVQSGLITGTMWDVIMKYITTKTDYSDLVNSTWGNYNSDTGLTYKKGIGRYLSVTGNISNGSFIESDETYHYGIRTTAFSENTKKKNIYDLAGNLWERTEEFGYQRMDNMHNIARGGSFQNNNIEFSVICKGLYGSESGGLNCGFRPVLYIK